MILQREFVSYFFDETVLIEYNIIVWRCDKILFSIFGYQVLIKIHIYMRSIIKMDSKIPHANLSFCIDIVFNPPVDAGMLDI